MRHFAILYTLLTILLTPLASLAQEPDSTATHAASELFFDAVQAYSQGQYAQAQALFEQVKPEDDAVLYYIGQCKLHQNQADAGQFLERAVAADSTNTWYLDALMSYYKAVGENALFANIGERLLKISPSHANNPYTLCLVAGAMLDIHRDSLAISYYNRALEFEPDYPPALYGLMGAYSASGNIAQYITTLEQFIRHPMVHDEIKIEYLSMLIDNLTQRKYWLYGAQLIQLVDICYQQFPHNPKAHYLRLRAYLIQGKSAEAISQCEQMAAAAIELQDKESIAQAYHIMGDIYYSQGKQRECFRAYDKALEFNPDYIPILNNYAYYLSLKKRQLRKALKMSAHTLELEPDNATYLDTYGWILYLMKRPAEAKPHFKRAMIYGGKENPEVLNHYSQVLRALGEDALADYYANLAKQKANK